MKCVMFVKLTLFFSKFSQNAKKVPAALPTNAFCEVFGDFW
jgi:hypothetical protein